MRLTTTLVYVIGLAILPAGCNYFSIDDLGSGGDSFLAIDATNFGSPEVLPVLGSTATAASSTVVLPEDLMLATSEPITLSLSTSQVDVGGEAAGRFNPRSIDGAFHATITFLLAPPGADVCASGFVVGPYDVTILNGSVQIGQSTVILPEEVASLVRSGQFEICAQTSADFDGVLSVNQLVIEFGQLRAHDSKVELCHITPGNPANRHTITVASSAVQAHLAHGDYLGPCLDTVQELQLSSSCSDNPDVQQRWSINNPNATAIEVTWEVYGTTQTGTLTAAPGDTEFSTDTTAGPNTTIIRWRDENGVSRSAAKASSGTACNPDADGDGVQDAADLCPGTPTGELVDLNGCGCSQLDEDSDGISDCEDLCPGTPAGAAVDAVGCETMLVGAGADVSLNEVGLVTLQGTASGGQAPYSYYWSAPGWVGTAGQDVTVMVSTTTTFTLTVTDWSFPPQSASDTVVVTVAPRPNLQYTITNLGALSTRNSYATALNNQGQVVGRYVTDAWVTKPFLYSNGVMTDLGTLGGTNAEALGINNAGQVVGRSQIASGAWHAFVWDAGGGMRDLGTLGGASSEAYAINDAGQITGFSETGTDSSQAFIYSGGVMTAVDTTGYPQSAAFDINSNGHVAGILLSTAGDSRAFSFDTTLHDLGSPLLSDSEAWLINDRGIVAGHSWASGQYRSFIYAAGSTVDLGSITGFAKTYAWGLSETGQVVGSVSNTSGIPLSHAFVYTGGSLYDLNSLLVPGHGWESLVAAYGVNQSGNIVGYGKVNGLYRAFLLMPVP